jgi:translation initiation factor IF-2
MAKVRVYELAKELNMESKKLVEKLTACGMNIKNYMSTLDEEAVVRAKEIVSGAVSEVIEERRIKPRVIRRRKKIIRVGKKHHAEKAITDAEEALAIPEPDVTPSETLKQEAAPGEVGLPKDAGEALPVREKVPVSEIQKEVMPPSGEETPVLVEVQKDETLEEPVKAGVSTDDALAKPVTKAKVKAKKSKKKKVDQPAKIIKLPEEGPLGGVLARQLEKKSAGPALQRPETRSREPLAQEALVEEGEEEERPSKGKAGKKKRDKAVQEDVTPKGIFRRRRKEIYERADLYNHRGLRPKDKRAARKTKEIPRRQKQTEITVPRAIKRKLKVQESVTVAELAKAMGIKASELIKRLIGLGVIANVNQPIDFETASVAADDFGYELELDTFREERFFTETEDRSEDLVPRPPVVTIMGHVDHGKTSLLDYVRKSNVTGGESGGITQHIGAYYVETEGGDIVFLDTPGHEAFTAMRARGAKVTDIIVLVVAADDGVMPQTKEAINHARAANIPIVVAINKIDKPGANHEKVKREMAELDLAPEEWGGDTLFGNISAKTGEGVDELLSLILLQSEMLELKGNTNKAARGSIIEARLDKSKGPVATVLIKNGVLRQGDHFICGEHYGKVRAMLNHLGKKMQSAGPSVPVEVYGISGVPMAGDEFIVVPDEKTSKQVVEHRRVRSQKRESAKRGLVSLDDLFERIKEGEVKDLNIVLKTDVQGSLEALADSLFEQKSDQVKLNIIHSATGAITESDVMLASASGAIIIGFNVRANPRVIEIAEKEMVDIRYYDVIYNVVKDIRLAMAGLLEPVYEEHVIGRANIKEIFRIPKIGVVAGCHVTDGHVDRNANIRLLRDDVVVFDGKISSLRRFKEDVKEVQSGYECGIGLENFQDIKPGDTFEVYEVEEVEAKL